MIRLSRTFPRRTPIQTRSASEVRFEHKSLARQEDGCVPIATDNLAGPQKYQDLHLTQAG